VKQERRLTRVVIGLLLFLVLILSAEVLWVYVMIIRHGSITLLEPVTWVLYSETGMYSIVILESLYIIGMVIFGGKHD
jgi:hypothetical protein